MLGSCISGLNTISCSEKSWTVFIKGSLSDAFMDVLSDAMLTPSEAFVDIVSETMVIPSDASADTSRWVLSSRILSEVSSPIVSPVIVGINPVIVGSNSWLDDGVRPPWARLRSSFANSYKIEAY